MSQHWENLYLQQQQQQWRPIESLKRQLLSLWIIGQHEHKDIFFYNRFQVFTVLDIDLAQNCTVRHLKLNF